MPISGGVRTYPWRRVGTEAPSAATIEWDGPARKEGER
jgi:hypothetical protein